MIIKSKVAGVFTLFVAMVMFGMFSPDAMAKKEKKVDICHKGQTINVSGNALQAHLDHGDFAGSCEAIPLTEWLNVRCEAGLGTGVFLISHVSGSEGLDPALVSATVAGTDCAVAQKAIQIALCQLRRDYGTPDAQTYVFNCPEAVVIP